MPNSTATRLAEIENDGYTIIEDAMSADLMARIREELDPFCQGKYPGRNNFEGTHQNEFTPCLQSTLSCRDHRTPSNVGVNRQTAAKEFSALRCAFNTGTSRRDAPTVSL